MDIFLDLEKTLLNDENHISPFDQLQLSKLALEHRIFILTTALLAEARALIPDPRITIVSTIENQMDPPKILPVFSMPVLRSLTLCKDVLSMYAIQDHTCHIFKYQERLNLFYPTQQLKLTSYIEVSSLIIACLKSGFEELKETMKAYSIQILAEDQRKVLFQLSTTQASKEDFLIQFKESPAIGIGDSIEDYSFIKHCEIQVAMLNGDNELKKLCPYTTSKTNQEGGAIAFIMNYFNEN